MQRHSERLMTVDEIARTLKNPAKFKAIVEVISEESKKQDGIWVLKLVEKLKEKYPDMSWTRSGVDFYISGNWTKYGGYLIKNRIVTKIRRGTEYVLKMNENVFLKPREVSALSSEEVLHIIGEERGANHHRSSAHTFTKVK